MEQAPQSTQNDFEKMASMRNKTDYFNRFSNFLHSKLSKKLLVSKALSKSTFCYQTSQSGRVSVSLTR